MRLVALASAFCALAGCRRNLPSNSAADEPLVGFDVQPIDAAALETDVLARHRSLAMPAGEIAARLGPYAMDSEDEVVLTEGNAVVFRELTKTRMAWDASANVRVATSNSARSLELHAVGEKAFVRLDKGHLRHKSRRDVDILEMLHSATSGLEATLAALGGIQLGPPTKGAAGAQQTYSYALALKERELGQAPLARAPKYAGAFAPSMPAAWSENASRKAAEGQIVVESEKGVVVRAAVRGSMRLSLAGRTLEMKVSHRRQVHHVGTVEPIAEPAGAVAEFRRPLRPREPLAFFRGMLAPGEDGVPTETPAAAEASAADARPSPRGAPRKAAR